MTTTDPFSETFSTRLCGASSGDVVWQDDHATFDRSDLNREVRRCGDVLTASGVGAGHTVALKLAPSATLTALLLAVWQLEARAMLIDHRLTASETGRLLGLYSPTHFVRATREPEHFVATGDVAVERRDTAEAPPDGACLVQFTSGSTGQSKVVGRSAISFERELARYALADGMPTAEDRLLLLCSPTHTWGLVGGVLFGLATGTPVLFPTASHGGAVARTAERLGATAVFGVPMHFDMLGKLSHPPALPQLRRAASAGAVMASSIADRFSATLGCPLGQVYGLTETGVVCTDIPGVYDAPSVGRATADTEVRVTDGELFVRMDASPYLVDDGVDRFADGWLRTFDRAAIDEAGVVTVLGRADSVVPIGGIKVDLMEVEQVLCQHPAVAEAVVTFGDVIEADVAVSDQLSADELTRWCRDHLSPIKIPKRLYLSDKLLRTPTGKIVRDRAQLVAARKDHAVAKTEAT